MKKTLALVLIAVMALALFTGCSDPVYDELENFLNVEMQDVNANYESIKAELATWETLTDDTAIAQNITDKILPLVNDSFTKLNAMELTTEEVKDLKAKYVKVMDAYKAGFEALLQGCETQDESIINSGYESIGTGVDLLNEYNAALEELATQFGAEIEY